jgi:hypothetical protein
MPEIEITIDKDGKVDIDLFNFHSQACSLDSETFARALGATVKRDRKPEYWQQEQKTQQHLRNG